MGTPKIVGVVGGQFKCPYCEAIFVPPLEGTLCPVCQNVYCVTVNLSEASNMGTQNQATKIGSQLKCWNCLSIFQPEPRDSTSIGDTIVCAVCYTRLKIAALPVGKEEEAPYPYRVECSNCGTGYNSAHMDKCPNCGDFGKKPEEIRPEYYGKEDPFEPWKIIRAKKMDFFQGNALKYLMHAGKKDSETQAQDIDKAITYLLEWRRSGNSHG